MAKFDPVLKQKRDWYNTLIALKEEGIEKGRKEIEAEIVKRMKEGSIPMETITHITGLSIDQINTL